jgi:hypothetical protein
VALPVDLPVALPALRLRKIKVRAERLRNRAALRHRLAREECLLSKSSRYWRHSVKGDFRYKTMDFIPLEGHP